MWTCRAALLAACLLLTGCGASYDTPTEPTTSSPTRSTTPAEIRHPITSLTPGTHYRVTREQVCTQGWATAHRDRLTITQERDILTGYGLPTAWATTSGHVSEWDHLIPLELGGNNTTENIWPMTNHDQDQRKDKLENRLHREVCAGTRSLRSAWWWVRHFWRASELAPEG